MLVVVLDFDGGGRLRCQLTDADPRTRCAIGLRVEMTFRRLVTAAGVHNYFWKARPVAAPRSARRTSNGVTRASRDQVAIVGMGCTAFGEHWDKSTDDLLVESATAALASAGRRRCDDIDAFWLGTMGSGVSGLTLSQAAAAGLQAGDPAGEHVRHRLGGAAQRLLRGGQRRLRRARWRSGSRS